MENNDEQMPAASGSTSDYDAQTNSLIPFLKAALDAGDRVTLLKRSGDDCKLPLWAGFNDPEVNDWNLGDLKTQVNWARSKSIPVVGYGVIMGTMSRNRFALDFDAGDKLEEIAAAVRDQTGIDLLSWPRVRSGRVSSAGYHLHARCESVVSSDVLARCTDDAGRARVVCEVVGDGKQLVGAGSLHKSGRLYAVESGDPNHPPVVSLDAVNRICEVIRQFDTVPVQTKIRPKPSNRTFDGRNHDGSDGNDIVDRYNSETDICSELAAYGYTDEGGEYFSHPNNDSGNSVHVLDENMAHHFGANDPFGTGQTSTPFSLFAFYEHGGDWKAATKALAERYGVQHEPQVIDPCDCVWPSDALLLLEVSELDAPKNIVTLESFEEVKAKPIDWIWPGRLARGKLTLICGDPGKGKSFLSLDIAARLSTGTAFPDGHVSRVGTTLLITDEDDSADTIKPRLLAMGANVAKIKRLQAIKIDGKDNDFTLAKIAALYDVIRQCPDLQLIVIDPLMSYFGKTKSADPAEVNSLLGKLNEFAAATGIAVVALVHLNKDSKSGNALYRSMGSISVVGKARLAFLVAPSKDDPEVRVVAQTKANAAAFTPSLAFKLQGATVQDGGADIATAKIVWQDGTVDLSADDLLGSTAETSNRQSAEDFLRQYVTKPMASDDVKAEAERRGISPTTLFRAKKKIGMKSRKGSVNGGW